MVVNQEIVNIWFNENLFNGKSYKFSVNYVKKKAFGSD